MFTLVNPVHCNWCNGFELLHQHVIDHRRRSLGKPMPCQWRLRLGGLKMANYISFNLIYHNSMWDIEIQCHMAVDIGSSSTGPPRNDHKK